MTPSIPHMESGTILGGYRIDGVAGQGGMGVVYRATQLGLDRPVALKVIASELADNLDFRNRFKSESQLAASIDHPNVVPVYEAGEADGVLYLAMRYVEGTDLRSLVDGRDGGLDARARGADHLAGRGRARRRPPPRPRAPRRQAAERADRPRGRGARLPDRLRPHQARRRRAAASRARASSSARPTSPRRSRSAASRPTRAPTSTRSAASSSTR